MHNAFRHEDQDIQPSGGQASKHGLDQGADVARAIGNIHVLRDAGERIPDFRDTLHSRINFHEAFQATLNGCSYAEVHRRAARRERDLRARGETWRYATIQGVEVDRAPWKGPARA